MNRLKMCILILFLVPLIMTVAQEKKVIIIDAGHGGKDSGAVGTNKVEEKEITLAIAKAMLALNKTMLDNQYDIYMTCLLYTSPSPRDS